MQIGKQSGTGSEVEGTPAGYICISVGIPVCPTPAGVPVSLLEAGVTCVHSGSVARAGGLTWRVVGETALADWGLALRGTLRRFIVSCLLAFLCHASSRFLPLPPASSRFLPLPPDSSRFLPIPPDSSRFLPLPLSALGTCASAGRDSLSRGDHDVARALLRFRSHINLRSLVIDVIVAGIGFRRAQSVSFSSRVP